MAGYWRPSAQSSFIAACDAALACPGGDGTGDELCGDGHSGPICGVCVDNYVADGHNFCRECASAGASVGFYVLSSACGLGIAYLILLRVYGKQNVESLSFLTEELSKASDRRHWFSKAKSKGKIIVSFFQIVTALPTTLQVRFPAVFREFSDTVSTLCNIETIRFLSVGCITKITFYTELLATTLVPIAVSAVLYAATVFQGRNLPAQARRALISSRFTVFLGLTYLVFASASTISFTTFLCRSYGEESEYLIADKRIKCETGEHKMYELYAGLMVALYPGGITALYSYLLFKHRAAIQDEETRDENPDIAYIGFLWKDYSGVCWWFEIFENGRRLSLTGLLVWFTPGSPGQLVTAMIITLGGLKVIMVHRPYVDAGTNFVSEMSQWSILFTLLAATMIQLKAVVANDEDEEESATFGYLLIFVNTIGVAAVVLGIAYKPLLGVMKALQRKHRHSGELRGLSDTERDWARFHEYFEALATSGVEEAGWEEVEVKKFTKKEVEGVVNGSVKGEVRCAGGDGGVDQIRLSFDVEIGMMELRRYLLNNVGEKRKGEKGYRILARASESQKDYEVARQVGGWGLFAPRKFVVREVVEDKGEGEEEECVILSRCWPWLDEGGFEEQQEKKRAFWEVSGVIYVRGWRLSKVGKGVVRAVYCEQVDLGGALVGDLVTRSFAVGRFKSFLSDAEGFVERERNLVPIPPDDHIMGVGGNVANPLRGGSVELQG